MYTLLGFICVCWLLASPGWRVFKIRRRTEDGGRTQLNRWLVSWFAFALLATVAWMWLYWSSCTSNNPQDKRKFDCPLRHPDTYMHIVIILAFVSNLLWLIYLCYIDLKKTLFHFGIGVVGACILIIIGGSVFEFEGCWRWLWLAGWIAIFLGSAATICRQMSLEPQGFSFFALFVASCAVLPELMWILNVIFVEQYTQLGKDCGLLKLFFDVNFYWKLSWTINTINQIDAQRRTQWRNQMSALARRFFRNNRQG